MIEITTAEDYNKHVKGLQSETKGSAAEDEARRVLSDLGFADIRKAKGKWQVVKWQRRPSKGQRGIGEVVPDKDQKLFGDWLAIWPLTGQAARFEVKARDGRLQYSALKKHQIEGLEKQKRLNGLAFLIWVDVIDVYVMQWPIIGFKENTSLKPTQAQAAHNFTLKALGMDHKIDRTPKQDKRPFDVAAVRALPSSVNVVIKCPECGSVNIEILPHGENKIINCLDCHMGSYINRGSV